MNLKAGLWQQQTLKLTMTQELTQAIALLQYSAQELTSFLENKALENPLLQVESSNIKSIDPRFDRTKSNRKSATKDKQAWIEQIKDEPSDLEDYIKSQLDITSLNPIKLKIIDKLIEAIDENGYLAVEIGQLSGGLQVPMEAIQECIRSLQVLEPAGIAAMDLKECLLLQLERMEDRNELAEIIISEHFNHLAEKKWKELSKLLGVGLKEIQEVFDLVQTLNPRPASTFKREKAVYVVPDVVVRKDGDDFTVSVFDELIPNVSFNEKYFKQLSKNVDPQLKRFLHEKQQDFQWIVKSLEQRKDTLIKVSLKIVEKQYEFFAKGPSYLKPMTMRDISEELDIHESTVSRTVREKYVQTPFGTFDLKSFFTSTIQTTSDENTSSKQVKEAIKRLIDGENKLKPLSDQDLVSLLKEQDGIVVSRRTIAKYRDQLAIPSSSKRKRYE